MSGKQWLVDCVLKPEQPAGSRVPHKGIAFWSLWSLKLVCFVYCLQGYQAGFMKGVSDSGFANCKEGEDCK